MRKTSTPTSATRPIIRKDSPRRLGGEDTRVAGHHVSINGATSTVPSASLSHQTIHSLPKDAEPSHSSAPSAPSVALGSAPTTPPSSNNPVTSPTQRRISAALSQVRSTFPSAQVADRSQDRPWDSTEPSSAAKTAASRVGHMREGERSRNAS